MKLSWANLKNKKWLS